MFINYEPIRPPQRLKFHRTPPHPFTTINNGRSNFQPAKHSFISIILRFAPSSFSQYFPSIVFIKMPSNEQQPGQGFFDRFFSNNPESLQEEIHQKLNSSPPPRTVHEEMDDMLKAFGFPAGFRAGELRQSGENEGHPFVSAFQNSSYRIHQDNNQVRADR